MLILTAGSWNRSGSLSENDGGDGGFTLLELIIVCVLIGLLLVISVPTLREGFINDSLKSSSRKLIGQIKGVRQQAIREQQAYIIFFDVDEERVWYLKESDAEKEQEKQPQSRALQMVRNVDIRDIWTKSNGVIDRGVAELWVSRQGYLDQTIIHLEGDDASAMSLVLSPFLPAIEVQEGYLEME